MLEDTAKVPLYERTIPQDPFAPGAEKVKPAVVPGTVGAYPLAHLLWASPHELLILRQHPSQFVVLNLQAKGETPLPELSRRWTSQKQFDPDMLAISPDGKWLVGYGGTSEKPTWVASEVRGAGLQEWQRDIPDPKSNLPVVQHPLIAWVDNQRWVELNQIGSGFVARVRTLGVDAVPELPLMVPTSLPDFPSAVFKFPQPNEGRMGGEVGVSANHRRQQDEHFVTWLSRVMPGSDSWRVETREVVWKCAEHPGFFHRCVLSPDGKRLAWENCFTETEAHAILISDAEGKNARVAYEHLYPMRNSEKGQAESISPYSLEWTPQGNALAFWRGEHGENGLCLLPVSPK